ncbi:MAG: hypothetical protein IJB33_00255 [Akkermansia sp.]|nr:hypothetical protein [Akkermansia sp.]
MNVYIEAHFKQESTGNYLTVDGKINEGLIPFGVAKFLPRRCGEISELSFQSKS